MPHVRGTIWVEVWSGLDRNSIFFLWEQNLATQLVTDWTNGEINMMNVAKTWHVWDVWEISSIMGDFISGQQPAGWNQQQIELLKFVSYVFF